jgi:hypothetical protein
MNSSTVTRGLETLLFCSIAAAAGIDKGADAFMAQLN